MSYLLHQKPEQGAVMREVLGAGNGSLSYFQLPGPSSGEKAFSFRRGTRSLAAREVWARSTGGSEASSVLTVEATSLPPLSLGFQNEGVALNESKLACTFMSCEPPLAAGCEQAEIVSGLENVAVPRLLGDTFLFLTTSPKPQSEVMCQLLGTSQYPVRILDPLCVLRAWKLFSFIFDLSACSSRLKTAVGK